MNMADTEQVGENNTQSLTEQLSQAFLEIKQHFYDLEATLTKKLEELEAKEREYEEKELQMHTLLAERKAAVASKEQYLLDRVQKLKDAAVAAVAEARANHQTATSESVDDGESKDYKLEESFAPVPLLKEYLKNLRRNSKVKAGNVDDVASLKNDANARELAALKTVINCIEEYKLEFDYPLDPLQKRVSQLEKSKADKKRSGEFNKRQQSKKPRANAGYFSFRSSGGRAASTGVMGRQLPPVRAAYAGIPDRYPHAGPITYNYQVPGQAIYTRPANAAPSNHGRYTGSSSLQSSHQPYM